MFSTFPLVLDLPPLLSGIISQLFSSFWDTLMIYVPMFILNSCKLSVCLFSFNPGKHLIIPKPRNQRVWRIMTLGMSVHVQNLTFPHFAGVDLWWNWKTDSKTDCTVIHPHLFDPCDENVWFCFRLPQRTHVGEINVTFRGGCIDSGIDFDITWLRERL